MTRAVDKDELDEEQEPELTVIKGVGPFAVALSKGASDLGLFDETPTPPNISAVRQVKPKKASRYFNPFIGVQVRDGAVAIGKGAKAVGKGGFLIEGKGGGDVIGGSGRNDG